MNIVLLMLIILVILLVVSYVTIFTLKKNEPAHTVVTATREQQAQNRASEVEQTTDRNKHYTTNNSVTQPVVSGDYRDIRKPIPQLTAVMQQNVQSAPVVKNEFIEARRRDPITKANNSSVTNAIMSVGIEKESQAPVIQKLPSTLQPVTKPTPEPMTSVKETHTRTSLPVNLLQKQINAPTLGTTSTLVAIVGKENTEPTGQGSSENTARASIAAQSPVVNISSAPQQSYISPLIQSNVPTINVPAVKEYTPLQQVTDTSEEKRKKNFVRLSDLRPEEKDQINANVRNLYIKLNGSCFKDALERIKSLAGNDSATASVQYVVLQMRQDDGKHMTDSERYLQKSLKIHLDEKNSNQCRLARFKIAKSDSTTDQIVVVFEDYTPYVGENDPIYNPYTHTIDGTVCVWKECYCEAREAAFRLNNLKYVKILVPRK